MKVIVVKQIYGDMDNVLECRSDVDDHVEELLRKHYGRIEKFEPEGFRTGYFECERGDFEFSLMAVQRLR